MTTIWEHWFLTSFTLFLLLLCIEDFILSFPIVSLLIASVLGRMCESMFETYWFVLCFSASSALSFSLSFSLSL
jgi:hypothetical protein